MTSALGADRANDPDDIAAHGVAWDLVPLLDGAPNVDALLDTADDIAAELVANGRGRIGTMSAGQIAAFHRRYAELLELLGRASNYAGLLFAGDTADPANGKLVAHVEERATAIGTQLLFIELEWAEASDEHVDSVLSNPEHELDFIRHHLRSARRYTPYLLTEPEERILTEKNITGAGAWGRLFDELSSSMEVTLDQPDGTTATMPLAHGLAIMQHPDRGVRQQAHAAVTAGLGALPA